LILAGYLLALIIMPIQHDFAVMDDWTYVHSAEQVASGHGFRPSEYAQSTMVAQSYWGALFATLFGANFTVFTAATMIMSLAAALTFYVLLRRLDFTPGLSGLGVALLTLNPYFINLSYSFMTEITFLALLLLSCLFYFEGLSGHGDAWLWLGGIFTALTFLTRQFGLAVAVAALLWLLYARRLTLTRLLAVLLLPLLAAVGYYAWSSGFPLTFSGSVSREELRDMRTPREWAKRAAHFIYLALFLPGLLVPLWGRVRRWWLIGALSLATGGLVFILWQSKLDLVSQGQSTLNELSYFWMQPLIKDPVPIYCIGAVLTMWLLLGLAERAAPGTIALLRRRREPQPVDFLYAVGIMLFVGTFVISSGFLDRYWLPVLPFLVIGGLTWTRGRSLLGLTPALVVLALVAMFGVLVRLDEYSRLDAQWQAGRWLTAQGVPYTKIENGYTWDGYFLHDAPVEKLGAGNLDIAKIGRVYPPTLVIDPEYVIDTAAHQGYHVVKTFPYLSRLGGMANRQWIVMQRD
jgi:hypothetical protein